jgi:prepilin-type N-terminal cleavage/methylation domain-containing protein
VARALARTFARPPRRRGFTLVEVLVVLSLLAVLMGLSVGLLQRSQSGNKLVLAARTLAEQLASARAHSYGSNTAYVLVHTTPEGLTTYRTYRNRQLLAWTAEDFVKASKNVIRRTGGVEISTDVGLEGRYAVFERSGSIDLGDRPWLDFPDGFAIECRLNPKAGGPLFQRRDVLAVNVEAGSAGRLGLSARIRLQPDAQGQGEGWHELRTGTMEAETVPEWSAPLLPGRWHDIRVGYDRNVFTIHVDGRLRAIQSDRKNLMQHNDDPLIIGGGYVGGFDSLVISGILEDDQDRFEVPAEVRQVTADGKVAAGDVFIHFRNRCLDPQHHSGPVRVWLELPRGPDQGGARRFVSVSASGETKVGLPEEAR